MGWIQKEFTQLFVFSQAMISKMESENYNFSIETLSKICHKVNLKIKIVDEQEKVTERNLYSFNIMSYRIEKDILYQELVTKTCVVTKYNLEN